MPEQTYSCVNCSANWSAGEYTGDCTLCGGGAIERDCVLCAGRCGSVYKRAVIDSWDSGEAHWIGSCLLPVDEKRKCMEAWLAKNRSGQGQ